jgi:hypothetical protein
MLLAMVLAGPDGLVRPMRGLYHVFAPVTFQQRLDRLYAELQVQPEPGEWAIWQPLDPRRVSASDPITLTTQLMRQSRNPHLSGAGEFLARGVGSQLTITSFPSAARLPAIVAQPVVSGGRVLVNGSVNARLVEESSAHPARLALYLVELAKASEYILGNYDSNARLSLQNETHRQRMAIEARTAATQAYLVARGYGITDLLGVDDWELDAYMLAKEFEMNTSSAGWKRYVSSLNLWGSCPRALSCLADEAV